MWEDEEVDKKTDEKMEEEVRAVHHTMLLEIVVAATCLAKGVNNTKEMKIAKEKVMARDALPVAMFFVEDHWCQQCLVWCCKKTNMGKIPCHLSSSDNADNTPRTLCCGFCNKRGILAD